MCCSRPRSSDVSLLSECVDTCAASVAGGPIIITTCPTDLLDFIQMHSATIFPNHYLSRFLREMQRKSCENVTWWLELYVPSATQHQQYIEVDTYFKPWNSMLFWFCFSCFPVRKLDCCGNCYWSHGPQVSLRKWRVRNHQGYTAACDGTCFGLCWLCWKFPPKCIILIVKCGSDWGCRITDSLYSIPFPKRGIPNFYSTVWIVPRRRSMLTACTKRLLLA